MTDPDPSDLEPSSGLSSSQSSGTTARDCPRAVAPAADCGANPAQGSAPRRLRRRELLIRALALGSAALPLSGGLLAGLASARTPATADSTAGSAGGESAEPQIGRPAPDFSTVDSEGHTRRLSEFKGKVVVLEWTNADCPYTRKHYTSGNMQAAQHLARDHGAIWLSVISSAPGTQGYVRGEEADDLSRTRHAVPTAVLLDATGTMGRAYHAKTTPHLYVIDGQGILRYMGGMDSIATSDVADIARAEPYLREALLAVVDGQPVAHPVTRPYGCSIKYR